MFEVGAKVLYKTNGVCTVTEIKRDKISEFSEEKEYYILKPLNDPNFKIYVPVESELAKQMKEILDADGIVSLVRSAKDEKMEWIAETKQRNEAFRNILLSGDRKKMILMAKLLYEKKQELSAVGKKLYAADDGAMKKAEKIIYDEFSLVLNIEPDEIQPFISGQIECEKK